MYLEQRCAEDVPCMLKVDSVSMAIQSLSTSISDGSDAGSGRRKASFASLLNGKVREDGSLTARGTFMTVKQSSGRFGYGNELTRRGGLILPRFLTPLMIASEWTAVQDKVGDL